MGLDMYLMRRTYVGHFIAMEEMKVELTVPEVARREAKLVKSERVIEVIEEMAYWRKANAIHGWFVENVQSGKDDCNEYPVRPDQLESLLSVVQTVLADPTKAQSLLPTRKGFFFGSYEYDQEYIYDLTHTAEMLCAVLAEAEDGSEDFYYHSSW